MPAIITNKTRIHTAQQFQEALSEASATAMYLFFGKVSPWPDDLDPPLPTPSDETEREMWLDMIGGKRIQASEASIVIHRHDWVSGTTYVRYDDTDEQLYNNKPFYVMTDEFNVYKCIDNNNNTPSTVKPTGTGTSIITLGDGYKWKYMYTVSTADAVNFLTDNWIPVKLLTVDDGSQQWIVQNNTIDGGIHAINISAGGSSYTSAPTVTIEGDGTGAAATATITGGAVTSIDITNPGSGYTYATVTLSGGGGSGAMAQAIMSPPGGHGKNALEELGGFFTMIHAKLENSEGGNLPVTNDFRKIGIMRDPTQFGTETLATATTFDQTLRLEVDPGYSGTFTPDEVITGDTSGATARVVSFDATNNIIHVNEVNGTFTTEAVTTTGGNGLVVGLTDPDLEPRGGDIIFIDHRSPISRAVDQSERVRVIFEL